MAAQNHTQYYASPVFLSKDLLYDKEYSDWDYFTIGCLSGLWRPNEKEYYISSELIYLRYFLGLEGDKETVCGHVDDSIKKLIVKGIIIPTRHLPGEYTHCYADLHNLFPEIDSNGKPKNYVVIYKEEIETLCKIHGVRKRALLFRYFVFIISRMSWARYREDSPLAETRGKISTFTYSEAAELVPGISKATISSYNNKFEDAGLIICRSFNFTKTGIVDKDDDQKYCKFSNAYARPADVEYLDIYCKYSGNVYKGTKEWIEHKNVHDRGPEARKYSYIYRVVCGNGLHENESAHKYTSKELSDAYVYIWKKNKAEKNPNNIRPLDPFYKYKPKEFFDDVLEENGIMIGNGNPMDKMPRDVGGDLDLDLTDEELDEITDII